jgi:hypothetical protein
MADREAEMSRLVITEPAGHAGRVLPLSGTEMTIGHSGTADIVVDDPYLSRRHALLSVDGGEVSVHDLNSTGGTFVNEERVDGSRVLRSGDQVRFADLVAVFEAGTADAAAPPTRPTPQYAGTGPPRDTEAEATAPPAGPGPDSADPGAAGTGSPPGADSEYESLSAVLAAVYGGPAAGSHGEGDGDGAARADPSGGDARALACAALAGQFSQLSVAVPVTGSDDKQAAERPAADVSLRAEFYYALFRAGLPANQEGLFQTSLTLIRAIWRQAARHDVIPRALADDVPDATAAFQALGSAPARQEPLASQLSALTAGHQPLAEALLAAEGDRPLGSMLDLVDRGHYDPANWAPLIGPDIPLGIPGADPPARALNYARFMAAQLSAAYPTAVLADQVRRGLVPVGGDADTAAGVADFLTAQQGSFEIGLEPVEAYIARTGLTGTPAAVIAQVKRLQQVYQLTTDAASMAILLNAGVDSARAVTRFPAAGFRGAFADKLGGTDAAAAVHTWAGQVLATSGGPRRSRALLPPSRR